MNLVVVVISMHVISETLKREKIYCLKHYLMQISRKIYVNYDLQRSLCLIYYPKSCKIQYLCVFERKKIWELSLIFNGETSWLDILHVSFKMGFKTPQPLKYNKTSFSWHSELIEIIPILHFIHFICYSFQRLKWL